MTEEGGGLIGQPIQAIEFETRIVCTDRCRKPYANGGILQYVLGQLWVSKPEAVGVETCCG